VANSTRLAAYCPQCKLAVSVSGHLAFGFGFVFVVVLVALCVLSTSTLRLRLRAWGRHTCESNKEEYPPPPPLAMFL
jgi:hypothetical protein